MAAERGLLLDCDLPVGREGVSTHNELVLSGWAVSPVGISGVAVQIGDRVWNASYGLDTPALVSHVGELPNVGRAGYHLRIDTSEWEPGPHYVTVAAFDMDGSRSAIEGSVDVQPFRRPSNDARDAAPVSGDELEIQLDGALAAEDHCDVTTPLRMTGWATAASGVEAVVVTLDGQTQHDALRPIARPDLLESHGAEIAAEAGFALELDAAECPPGPHTLTVVARARDGAAAGLERKLVCRLEPEPAPVGGEATPVAWLDERDVPQPRADGRDLRATTTMWEDRALLAEADAAASRTAAGFALRQQEGALRALRDAEQALERYRRDAEATRAELFAAQQGLTAATARLDTLVGSRSWRMTGPLRALARAMRRSGG